MVGVWYDLPGLFRLLNRLLNLCAWWDICSTALYHELEAPLTCWPSCTFLHKDSNAEMNTPLSEQINALWDIRHELTPNSQGPGRAAVLEVLKLLDHGALRVASPQAAGWQVQEWVKKAVLLSFRLQEMRPIPGGPDASQWYDKVANKFKTWQELEWRQAGFRAVPGAIVRHGAFIGEGAILMPCFVNIGAYIGAGTMVDSWVTVGSCAQIGQNVHLSGGVGIGGVLEPLQASPVIIEDECFIGARSEVVEGVIVERGAVLSMGVFIGQSTKIIDRESGEIFYGRVPAYSVVVPGTLPGKPLPDGSIGPGLYCAVIVKRVDAKTRAKTSINDLLRD
jgi:2,3,4,5-tetrahydropyridine-2,6-dicarboxylate N-succinyltransferase